MTDKMIRVGDDAFLVQFDKLVINGIIKQVLQRDVVVLQFVDQQFC